MTIEKGLKEKDEACYLFSFVLLFLSSLAKFGLQTTCDILVKIFFRLTFERYEMIDHMFAGKMFRTHTKGSH